MSFYQTLKAMIGAFDAGCRRSGRTITMLRGLKNRDIVVCLSERESRSNQHALHALYRAEFPGQEVPVVTFIVCAPRLESLYSHTVMRGVKDRLVVLDHNWELAFYEHALKLTNAELCEFIRVVGEHRFDPKEEMFHPIMKNDPRFDSE